MKTNKYLLDISYQQWEGEKEDQDSRKEEKKKRKQQIPPKGAADHGTLKKGI